jgi:hypothetical protein
MDLADAQTPAELIFPPQAPFSWTLRWARAHGSGRQVMQPHTFRIIGSPRSAEELSAALAFAREHDARIELG